MRTSLKKSLAGVTVLACCAFARATDVTIHLNSTEPISRNTMKYQCDGQGSKMGLPAGIFSVEYINGAGNSLAIVPVAGHSLIFANVTSGSGARYAAGSYIWWEAGGRGVTFSSDSIAGTMTSECHRAE
ncbi:MliC family protein [Tunturiibacter empetritectus]|uniref:Membrane-bound inhibitor of C-type lysozyme n=1 Tax=Tunturiibacter lichenicola TaxID=2051959 RepID=A0A852VND4_9BACT|nr:MliC family protein [Edaphobacter lichenicola]NYF91086.1 membrane-bound inhibitor of C-type lysozyme [Edaphobacter lichenicola]